MNASELIARLQTLPEDARVFVCDEGDKDLKSGLVAEIADVELLKNEAASPMQIVLLITEEW